MSYQVIARKYRPQRFSDVVGQEHVTQTLGNAIQQERIAHAYLFVGPRGTGKTTIARIFAKCLNCTDGPRVDFQDDDPRVREITEGRSLDVLEIDGASNRGIEEIRELRETVKYAPASCRFKIYIIDEVHMLTKEAFNALLKTLEEPPAHVKFMFATTEPEKVLPTILSRCQRFDLKRIPTPLIMRHLGHIAGLEKVEIEEAALHAIARGSEGCMRDAESTLDQLISFCGDRIGEADVLSMFGLAARTQILELAAAILKGEAGAALAQFHSLAGSGKDLSRLITDLLQHFRNLLIFHITKGDLSLLEIADSEKKALETQAEWTSATALARIMDLLSDCESKLRHTASKKIFVEISLLKAAEARNAIPLDSVLKKLHELRSESGGGASAQSGGGGKEGSSGRVAQLAIAPAPALTASSAPAERATQSLSSNVRSTAAPAEELPGQDQAANLERLWAQLMEAVGSVSQFTRSYLGQAFPVSLSRSVFTVGFDEQAAEQMSLVDNPKTRTLLQTKLRELGCPDLNVRFITTEPPAGRAMPEAESISSSPAPIFERPAAKASGGGSLSSEAKIQAPPPMTPMTKEDFKNDPLIKEALEIFKGQIVDVRT